MNNDYDRATPDDESTPRYTMTSFNKDKKSLVTEETYDFHSPVEKPIGLFLLMDGTTIVSQYTENIGNDSYILEQPLLASIQSSSMTDGVFTSSIAYDVWMPLSKERKFTILKSVVVVVSKPLDTLVESYKGNKNG
ncbi:MAG: hypothetical protein CMQ57_00860 [Gammaproteobacteria bacterium]|nr:hypothetical protein [Gammaproteobacteria bacterium]|tara:strand:- start:12650 stop:13057 length:408 start_codon:yes stop_codon:yes gene_type:complete